MSGCDKNPIQDNPQQVSSKIVNDNSSSEKGTLLVEFNTGDDVPSDIIATFGTITLEHLFPGSNDSNLKRWFIAKFSSEISSESVASLFSERDDVCTGGPYDVYTASNVSAMDAGRANAGSASALLGAIGYAFGGVVPAMIGLGDMFIMSGMFFVLCSVLTFAMVIMQLNGRRKTC